MAEHFTCPVCDGHGTVTRPPWIAGDQPTWTSSDVFTVYFRVRNFRQNPAVSLPSGYVGPIWDATDPRYIVDDTRYVMLVDRTEVNRPRDRPKILYLEKLPN